MVALVTPMTADGEVDWPGVEKHIDDVIEAGADGIVVTGTTGETSTLTDPEKIRLVEVGKDVAGGRAKIITGGGSNETAHAIGGRHDAVQRRICRYDRQLVERHTGRVRIGHPPGAAIRGPCRDPPIPRVIAAAAMPSSPVPRNAGT